MTAPRQRLLPARLPLALRVVLIAQIFTVFLTGTKLIPTIRNNFGPFEIIGLLLFLLYFAFERRLAIGLNGHPIPRILALMTALALLSLTWFQGPNVRLGVIQTLILAFMLVFVLVVFNLMLRYQVSPHQLLRLVTYSALIIGPWVLLAGIGAEGDIQEAGPFRNRSHMANYMLTAFWLVLIYNSWPGLRAREKLLSYAALASTLYPIAVSGRRSVYLSLIFGLVGVALAFVPAQKGRRMVAVFTSAVLFGVIGLFYWVGPQWLPQLRFFQQRVGGIGERLGEAVGSEDNAGEAGFAQLQRQGVAMALRDRPFVGIGWGAFYRSAYSPTGHEVHSMPLRFLAELGLLGFVLYLSLMGYMLFGALKTFYSLRDGPYRMPALVFSIALWSLSVSYVYNRHITERTFWILVVFFLSFEAFARSRARLRRPLPEPLATRAGPAIRPAAAARPRLGDGARPATHWASRRPTLLTVRGREKP